MVGLRGWRQLGSPPCSPTNQKLRAYGGITVPLRGQVNVRVILGEQARQLTLLVTDLEQGSNLMGLDWLDAFGLRLSPYDSTCLVEEEQVGAAIKDIALKHEAVFQPGMGACTLFKAHLVLKPGAQPKMFKPRPLPFALMDAVKAEIQRLSDQGIWKPVPTSQWAAPIVVVKKASGGIRICGDFKVTVNPQLEVNQFPIPRLEELLVKLQHGRHFSKIDLADAYLQIELDEESKKLMVVNTPFGLFQYQRLPFGVASAPAIFQQLMAQLTSDVPGCAAYLDDIIVTGKDVAEHVQNLETLFARLKAAGLRCKLEKCSFFSPSVEYVGHIISAGGIRPSEKGVQAIKQLPRPRNVDTGATSSMVGLRGWRQLGSPPCSPTNQKLRAYGGITVPLRGQVNVRVILGEQARQLTLLVTDLEQGSNLMGLDWLDAFGLRLSPYDSTCLVEEEQVGAAIKDIALKHEAVFQPGMGACTLCKAHLVLKPGAQPKMFKPRPLPFALMDAVKAEIQRLSDQGIWKPVPTSQWAAPIVVVKKASGGIRICGDFKVTVNPQLEVNQFPIPRLEELLVKLQHGRHFSKIDLADAYLQIELDEESKKLMVVNTPFGLFQYQRLPFGVASAPAIFQQLMAQLTSDVPGCAAYLDDIIVTGKDVAEHVQNLETLFARLKAAGLRCKLEKCSFFSPSVEYVGHIISAGGIRPSEKGVQAIKQLPRPRNVHELRVFLGKVNYYAKFLKNFADDCALLNALRKKNASFIWMDEHQLAFERLKGKIAQATVLAHFREDLPLVLATDASQYGIGAVLLHRYADGTEKPIAHASKTLTISSNLEVLNIFRSEQPASSVFLA
ncbi:hypothetical protein M513_10091 [Trichuris suis]|uniref:Reverse transcriptase domain-containing protein n=1 Tax=Trichuris suis TaxID=68888 RepID=A0A085LVP7_9BILA|nr:hypothetical protein M513_10091 [Trichuris suis]